MPSLVEICSKVLEKPDMKILTILLTERQTNGKIKQQSLISAFSPELKRCCVELNNYFLKKRFFFQTHQYKE